jgi:hypothetical protein
MTNVAEDYTLFDYGAASDPAFTARVEMLRAAIAAIPKEQRTWAFRATRDLWPGDIFERPKLPHRGGDVLNNVLELFRRDPQSVRGAPEVQAELAKSGIAPEPQAVRNALSYLSGRCVLRRVGYGKYQLEDGRIIDGLP